MLRAFTPTDIPELERIHSSHFKDEFFLPDMMKYICAYVAEDEKGVVTFGGIRTIAECVIVTDKDRSAIDRAKALREVLSMSKFVCHHHGYDQIYAWSQNPQWYKRLLRSGFRPPQGQSLILDL